MDIHRCRFVPFPATAINALAFSHISDPHQRTKVKASSTVRLAIGRASGDIEIWNPAKGSWVQETILRGGKGRSIEGLVWTEDCDLDGETPNGGGRKKTKGKLRLFSIGYSTVITEWNLSLGKPQRHSGGNYGEIWCLAAQPLWKAPQLTKQNEKVDRLNSKNQHLVVGCADGTLVLHSTEDGDLHFLRIIARANRKKSRVLSIAFLDRERVVAGYADSTIRVFDVRNGTPLGTMSLGAGGKGAPTETLVWAVKCLPDGTIVSGDSGGEVRFWDGQNFTLIQRIKSHRADILDITTSADGMTVMTGGMDRRNTVFERMYGPRMGKTGRWAEVSHQRCHSHDVKALATYETAEMSIVASGGVDATPIIMPLRRHGQEHTRTLPAFPQLSPLQSAPSQRLLMCWWDCEVSIWRLGGLDGPGSGKETSEGQQGRKKILKMEIKGEESLTSVAFSCCGTLLVTSSISEVKIFQLTLPKSYAADGVKVRKMTITAELASDGAKMVQFSPDSRWLAVVRNDNAMYLYRITNDTKSRRMEVLIRAVQLHRLVRPQAPVNARFGSHGDYERSITRIAWSSDSRVLVTCDISGFLDSWVLQGHEDHSRQDAETADVEQDAASSDEENEEDAEERQTTVIRGQRWIRNPKTQSLPRLPSPPLIISFRPVEAAVLAAQAIEHTTLHPIRHNPHPISHELPDGEGRLFILTMQHEVYEYQVLAGGLSPWSRRNPPAFLPSEFKIVRDRAMGCVWDVGRGRERIWLYGASWLWMFDLSRDLPTADQGSSDEIPSDGVAKDRATSRKRKRGLSSTAIHQMQKNSLGAGDKILPHQLNLGIGDRMRKTIGTAEDGSEWISLQPAVPRTTEEDGDDDDHSALDSEGGGSALVRLRRAPSVPGPIHGHAKDIIAASRNSTDDPTALTQERNERRPLYWHTYKYRPILGIVPLGRSDDGEGNHESAIGVEVALVERPPWDVDFPPRYEGDQEWNR